jgi:ankyrin repeat protein
MNHTSFPKDLHAAAIYMAQVYGDAEMEKMLWLAIDDVNAKVDDGDSLMHLASEKGYAPLLKLLHQANAGIDIKDSIGMTPIMRAARSGHLSCVQFLVEQGAKIEYGDDEFGNCSCLMEATINGHTEVVSYLLDAGANVDAVDWKGRTSLVKIFSNKACQATVMQLLLDHGANIDAQDNFGCTALINATYAGNTDAVKLLLENGVNTMIRDNDKQIALDIATHQDFIEIANLIRHHDEQNMECAP